MKKYSFFCFFLLALMWFWGCSQRDALPSADPDLGSGPAPTEQAVSAEQAAGTAQLFWGRQAAASKSASIVRTVRSIEPLRNAEGRPVLYVLNYAPNGFVLVGATRGYYPILAYSEDGSFAVDPDNGGLNEWLDGTRSAIGSCGELPDSIKQQIAVLWRLYEPQSEVAAPQSKSSNEEWAAYSARIRELRNSHYGYNFYALSNVSPGMFPTNGSQIYDNLCRWADDCGSPREYTIVAIRINNPLEYGPLLRTEWHQYEGFNDKCPPDCPAGCVAIAMAQIMNYHRHPAGYNWNNMPDTYGTESTQTLIYDIGQAVYMDYSPSGSGSNIINAQSAFQNVFGYSARWITYNVSEVESQILLYRPVYFRGIRPVGAGHAWVCDGISYSRNQIEYFAEYRGGGAGYYYYSTPIGPSADNPSTTIFSSHSLDLMHMNWGWRNGNSNGWYRIDGTQPPWIDYSQGRECLLVSPNKVK